MIIDFILFPLFILCVLLLGATFDQIISKLIGCQGRLSVDLSIHGLFGFFFLGVMAFIANFFIHLSSPLFLLVIIFMLIVGALLSIQNWSLISKPKLIYLFISSLLLVPLVANMSPGFDGGLYHLPHQLWLREERIVFGLANLHGRFGFSSILEYVYAPLWINSHFKLLSYSFGAFFAFFILFLVSKALATKGPVLALIMGVLVNLTFYYGYLQWGYTYTDTPAGFLFVIVFLYGFWMLYSEKEMQRREWAIFSILTLFMVLIKPSTVILALWVLFVITYLLASKATTRRELLTGSYVSVGIAVIWILRSIIVSGCLLYPEKLSCMDVSWAAITNAESDSNWITAWARHMKSGLYSLEDSSWFSSWWFPYYQSFLRHILIAGAVVFIFYASLSAITKFRNFKFIDARYSAAVLFVILALSFWFWKAPTPRFGIGVFILFTPVIFIFFLGKTVDQRYLILQKAIIIILPIVLMLRISAPWSTISTQELVHFKGLNVPTPAVEQDDKYGVRPKKGKQCWIVPECGPGNRPKVGNMFFFKAFYPDN